MQWKKLITWLTNIKQVNNWFPLVLVLNPNHIWIHQVKVTGLWGGRGVVSRGQCRYLGVTESDVFGIMSHALAKVLQFESHFWRHHADTKNAVLLWSEAFGVLHIPHFLWKNRRHFVPDSVRHPFPCFHCCPQYFKSRVVTPCMPPYLFKHCIWQHTYILKAWQCISFFIANIRNWINITMVACQQIRQYEKEYSLQFFHKQWFLSKRNEENNLSW